MMTATAAGPLRVNLGCGTDHLTDFVNVDISPDVGADVVHDLDAGPWPFGDGAAQIITAQDVFEHVHRPILFMRESHRILAPGGALLLKVPHWMHRDAYTDPTHVRFCTEHSFDYWIKGTALYDRHNAAYGGVAFDRVRADVLEGAIYMHLVRI